MRGGSQRGGEATDSVSTATPATLSPRMAWYSQLYIQVIIAVAAGIALGAVYPSAGESVKPLGDALIKMIKMMIAPIVLCTVVHGIASVQDIRMGRSRRSLSPEETLPSEMASPGFQAPSIGPLRRSFADHR